MKIYTFLLLFLFITGCNNFPDIKSKTFHYDLFSPEKSITTIYQVPEYYSPDKKFPLMVILHGHGENAEAFAEVWREATNSLGFVLLAVQGENKISDEAYFAWGKNAEEHILCSIDEIKKIVNINDNEIYLGGFSAGASLANYLSLKYPFQIRGTISISGSFPFELFQKSLVNSKNKFCLACGELEKNYSEQLTDISDLLTARNVKVKSIRFKNAGHTIPKPWNETIQEMLKFLKEK